jgi:putative flippase GtrA
VTNLNRAAFFFRFLLIGGSGFLIDVGITYLLYSLGLSPWIARIPAIALAMTFTWAANRQFTYRVTTSRTVGEALRYATVAASMASINYIIYFVLVSNGISTLVAVTFSTACQTIVSFYLYRHFVFSKL